MGDDAKRPSHSRANSCLRLVTRARLGSGAGPRPAGGAAPPRRCRGSSTAAPASPHDRPRDPTPAGRRKLNQRIAVEPRRRGVEFFGGKLVGSQVFVRELQQDLELDRHEVVPSHPLRPPSRLHRLHGVELRAPHRDPCIGEHFRRALGRRLLTGRGDRSASAHNSEKLSDNAHCGSARHAARELPRVP